MILRKKIFEGMYVRLAFAVAAHLQPEILIIDEVLAVGDAGFKRHWQNERCITTGRTALSSAIKCKVSNPVIVPL